jgi:N-acetylneuraminate synthase
MSKSIIIGSKAITKWGKTFVIAEIGINHNGEVSLAKALIDAAKEAGCDAVKFQKRSVERVYTQEELAKLRENPFGPTNGDLKRGLEFSKEQYAEIIGYCKKKDIITSASPWDEGSVDFLAQFDVPFYKVASASLTDDGILLRIKGKGKPVIISVGMSTEEEIEHAVSVLGTDNLILLHTTSNYPTEPENAHLRTMLTLQEKYPNVPVGYSGHEEGIFPSIISVAMGACVIERHLTLDRNMWGSDQKASIEPLEMKEMIGKIREVEVLLGNPQIQCLPEEIPVKNKLRRKG